ncbi:MAG: family 78 glycoside hydrolase catalytic domain [Bacteroidales bacterium]|jgi:alpha-L-rhamnosidase|nr:family 78 glycoside hydrolase catalytic domain [Bacteroidales bacterium]
MKTIRLFLLLLSFSGSLFAQNLLVSDLSCDNKRNPLGIDNPKPGLSWKISGSEGSLMQTAYSIRVATDPRFSGRSIIWESGKVNSDESVLREYGGPAPLAGTRYYWQVRIWDNKGNVSKWSETGFWETGLLSPAAWKASWIELEADTGRYSPSPHFRKDFVISKRVASARVYVTSHGFYELHLNGKKVGDQVLTPGWTSYSKRLQYQVYDVTEMLAGGRNAIGAVLGDGWYRGSLAWEDNWAIYGKRLGLLMQMRIVYTDGSEELILTDGTWKGIIDGAIRMNDIYNGETYDANRKLTGWNLPGYDDSRWQSVSTGSYSLSNLIASEGAAIRKIEEIKAVKVFRTPSGKLVADMGQNMVGWIRLKVNGPAGTTVTLRHAEVMDKYGEFYTENLRAAKCTITYTLAGGGEETYEPRFTFMGFRYVEVTGFPGELKPENLTGVVVHSDMKPTGTYESSNELLNQLQHNIQWGQKGNFVDVPTDCPQRDERLGWTGDAQAFCRTAAFNYDVAAFFTKWLKDVTADQKKGGEIPDVIPDVLNPQNALSAAPSAGWGDVAVIAPWTMYRVYGDLRFLENQYAGMKAWVDYIMQKAGDDFIWNGGSKYGDWLFYHPPVNSHTAADGYTDPDFIATAFYAYSAKLLSEAAGVLGKTDDEQKYLEVYEKIKGVFNHEYVTPAGRVGTNSQTSYVLALMFDLLPEELRAQAAAFLVADIRSRQNHLSTGFLGTPYLCHVLSQHGYTDVAYDLLLQETYPSWLYPVKMGATTIWERWDGQKPDSTFQDAGMNSFNHYAYGAIGDWMYRVSAGIEILEPGYRYILIKPSLSEKLEYSKASFESPYGKIASGWERTDGRVVVSVSVPPNTKARIVLPVKDASLVSEGDNPLSANRHISDVRSGEDGLTMEAGSGSYKFVFKEQ